jgi:hypothetical protein
MTRIITKELNAPKAQAKQGRGQAAALRGVNQLVPKDRIRDGSLSHPIAWPMNSQSRTTLLHPAFLSR